MLKLSSGELRRSIYERVATLLSTKFSSYETTETRTYSSLPSSPITKRHVAMVSTTRGVPSTSNDLKEALCEKIPLHYDLMRKFRAQYGSSIISQITVDDLYNGLRDVRTGVRETTENDSKNELRYRGLTIPEILGLLPCRGNAPSPEAVFWLLLTGDVPTQEQTASLIADWTLRRERRKNCWLDSDRDTFVGKVVKALPNSVAPLGRLSVALTALEGPEMEAVGSRTMSYNRWEQTYEEGMEFLAILPAIVGLVKKTGESIKENCKQNDDDWVDFFVRCSEISMDTIDEKKHSLGDFLRLYIAVNADADGGTPSVHVNQILGGSRMQLSKAMASGVLAYFTEPQTGTMHQCMEFQSKIENILGREPSDEALNDYISRIIAKENDVVGHEEAKTCDSRYVAFSKFSDKYLSENSQIKLSKQISRVLTLMGETNERKLLPEQSCLAAPIFQSYGLKDMEFNQVILCMSRALGAVASIIWARAVDIPVENPKFQSTYTYFDYFRETRRTNKFRRPKVKYIKYHKDRPIFFSIDR